MLSKGRHAFINGSPNEFRRGRDLSSFSRRAGRAPRRKKERRTNRRSLSFVLASLLILIVRSIPASAQTPAVPHAVPESDNPICPMIQSAARANKLPVAFLARLIWVESRFKPDEIGPLTRTGERALGIAQFMPGTALEHHLFAPFDPVEALPKSGEFLAELRDQFGNLGLAAAAYNAGPQRVRDFIAGLRDLPMETRNYVLVITGRSVESWSKPGNEQSNEALPSEPHTDLDPDGCPQVMSLLPSVAEAEKRKVPSWCSHLQHPSVNMCGPVHQEVWAINSFSLPKSRYHSLVLKHHRADTVHPPGVTVLQ